MGRATGTGPIDADEYGAYYQAQPQVGVRPGGVRRDPDQAPEGRARPDARKPAARTGGRLARPGKLPPGLPGWFAEYDADSDGQVGLYEWRRKGRPIKEFVPMDRNEDGYLTPKEVLDYLAEQAKTHSPSPTDPKKGGR